MLFVCPTSGRDTAAGTLDAPLRTLHHAVNTVRAARAGGVPTPATIILRGGSHFLPSPLQLGPGDSHITFAAYPGESASMSGGVPLDGLTWNKISPPSRSLWEARPGGLNGGFELVALAGRMTLSQAQATCAASPLCTAFSFPGNAPNPTGPVQCTFVYNTFWAPSNTATTWVINRGYIPGAANLWVADTSTVPGLTAPIDSLWVGGVRGIRARYPNVGTVELLGPMQILASWTKQPQGTNANYTYNPAFPSRNDSADGYFQTFRIGVGGPCAERFTPQASYWCSDNSQGGGPGPYEAPVGMTVTNAPGSLPHTPYTHDITRANVHSWRAGRWFSWVFGVGGQTVNGGGTTTTFSFNRGGNQGSRGGDAGQEMFIDNVLDELDAPGEFYHDVAAQKLYLWVNGTAPPPTAPGSIVAGQLTVLVNVTGTQASPVVATVFNGITFTQSAPNFLGPHGTPSGGDWAVGRSAAVFFEGTQGTVVNGCLLTNLDGNGVFFSGYNRGGVVTKSEFFSIGESAVLQWGYTDGSPVPGMGFDATAGNQPRGTEVSYNLVHEVGIWTKQNSFYFQVGGVGEGGGEGGASKMGACCTGVGVANGWVAHL